MSAQERRARRGRRSARGERGFTLVELIVAMVAGLIVALAVVGLSKEASNTFHEETRIASAEMQLRTAIDRLRADVARASFMSTGNIYIDPQILTSPGTPPPVATNINATYYVNASAMSLSSLAGIRLWAGGSAAATPLSSVNFPAPNLGPDMIDLAGNMTGVEILPIGGISGLTAIANNVGCGGQGQRIYLNVLSSPAIWRLVGMSPSGTDAAYGQQLASAFQPVAGASFIVRVVDNTTGKVQFAATCPTTQGTFTNNSSEPASWNVTANGPQPYVDLDSNSSITLPGISVNATINPIQIVRWQIGASLINPPGGATDPTKYDLTRQFLDAKGNPAGTTPTPEVVAEYAVDLKFAFSIDNLADVTGNYGTGPNMLVVNAFEDSSNGVVSNATAAGSVTTAVVPYAGGAEPQRIRSVRVRLVTRAPMQDRSEPLAVSGAATDYLYRYCLVNNATACAQPGAPVFARTRTLISEVSLPNQASLWFR